MPCQQPHSCDSIEYLMSQKFAAKVLTFYEMGNTRFTEYLRGKHGIMTMDILDFLNLFSQHILPARFVRIRHYGFLSPCNRETLRSIQQQLNVMPVPKVRKKKSYLEICNEKGWKIGICKDCNCRRIVIRNIDPAPRAPPFRVWHMAN